MKIKLMINGSVNYYFCGTVALNRAQHTKLPLEVELDSLTEQEIVGLARASYSGVITVAEGNTELLEKASYILSDTKLGKKLDLSLPKEELVLETEEEVKEKEVEEEVKEEKVEEEGTPVVEEPKEKPVKKVTNSKAKAKKVTT